MYDNILHIFHSDARSIADLNFYPSPLNCLITIHEKLIVPLENDPEWLWFDHAMSKCAWLWIFWIIRRVHTYMEPFFPPNAPLPKPIAQSAKAPRRLEAQFAFDRQQESTMFITLLCG